MNASSIPDLASVLLVEDDGIIALAQRKALEAAGYRVRVSHTGEAAVAAVTDDREIDIVLMDIDLGAGMDGPEAARQILTIRELPIVFVTSHSEQSFVDRVEAITKYGYVLKRAGTFTLVQAMKTALQLFAAHQTLKKSEDRFRTLFENTPSVSIQGYAPDGTVRFWNRASETLYGYTAEEALGNDLLDLIIPESMRAEVAEAVTRSLESGEPIPPSELELRRKDGGIVNVYSSHALVRYPDGETEIFCLDMDISERKETEAALRRQEEEYRTLIQQQSELIVRVDADGAFEFVSDSYCAMFGKKRDELIGHSFLPLVHEDDRETTRAAMEALYAPPYRCRLEQRAWTVDGWRWLEWDDTAIVNDAGEITAILGAGRDITDRKIAEEEKQAILNALPIPVIVSEGPEERVLLVNAAFTDLFGYTVSDIPDASHWFDHAYPNPTYRAEIRAAWQKILVEAEQDGGSAAPITVDATGKDGSVHTVAVRSHVLGEKKLVTFVDLTDITVTQSRLEQSVAEKERLMLELNHRVKNNLSLVASLIHLKESELNGSVDLSDIRGQINAIELIHEKLFSTGELVRMSLRTYLDDLLPTVFSFFPGNRVQVANSVDDFKLPTASLVSVGVLLNELAVNAMKHGFDTSEPPRFTVTSELSNGTDDDHRENSGTMVTLVVSNNGRAFPSNIDLHTAQTLGLQLITSLVEQLKGTIELSRTPETTFVITFPLSK